MRDESAALGTTLEFMRLLWSLAHSLQSRSKRMESAIGVTGPQRLVIRMLGRMPGSTAGALARAMCVHPSTLTGVLRRLETRNLIERKRDDVDGRKAKLFLTPAGKRLDSQQAGTVEAAVRRTLSRLEQSEIQGFGKVLAALADELSRTDR